MLIPEPLIPEEKLFMNYFSLDEIINELNNSGFEVMYKGFSDPYEAEGFDNRKLFLIVRK